MWAVTTQSCYIICGCLSANLSQTTHTVAECMSKFEIKYAFRSIMMIMHDFVTEMV